MENATDLFPIDRFPETCALSSANIIEVHDLQKSYRSGWFGGTGLQALRGVSLTVQAGEIFGLLGPNGAGKTTLIKSLLGVVRTTSGEATLFGHPVGTAPSRARVGYLPENLRIEKHHTARSALRLYGHLSRMPAWLIRQRVEPLLSKVGLQGRDCESVRRFSKGMYQRLGLAQALMHNPDLLILDEPTDGLDPVGRLEMRNLLKQLRDEGKTIFLNSHILQEVEAVCDRVAVMAQGAIRALGSIDQLTANADQPVEFQLLAELSQVQGVVSTLKIAQAELSPWPNGQHAPCCRLVVHCHEETEIDRVVDGLRAAAIPIRELKARTQSLESVFFALLDQPSESVS